MSDALASIQFATFWVWLPRQDTDIPWSLSLFNKSSSGLTYTHSVFVGGKMGKGYWITFYKSVSNPEALAQYGKVAIPAIEAAGGRVLSRGIAIKALEGGIKERTVLVE